MRQLVKAGLATLLAAAVLAPAGADAFCGFYVGGADAKLYNNATMVVMMREGTRTVLSMQNNYQGPPANFAMVVPVPVVLQEENVKTLPREVFDRIDTLAAPRLVEYWEQDPCYVEPPRRYKNGAGTGSGSIPRPSAAPSGAGYGVTVEAQFTVGEYEIVILSAKEATGLDAYLRDAGYKIPEGAEPLLRPYVAEGSKFFVAKVNPEKVTFKDGQAMLSPLRFHYDTEDFELPVRLGMINSGGTQDLIVHILARGQRYEVANYKNVTIPTNLDVAEDARGRFGEFYAALFDATIERNPGAVVTEYAWMSTTCDPCPSPPLSGADIMTLGADALVATAGSGAGSIGTKPGPRPSNGSGAPASGAGAPMARPPSPARPPPQVNGFVLTRLHARYGKDALGEDLVFKAAPPIAGGREVWKSDDHQSSAGLEHGSEPGGMNNFQGRYIIRHPWAGEIKCDKPVRWRWGGPPAGEAGRQPAAAKDLAFAPRGGVQLAQLVRQDVPELALVAQAGPATATDATKPAPGSDPAKASTADAGGKKDAPGATSGSSGKSGCGCRAGDAGGAGGGAPAGAALVTLGVAFVVARRRPRR